MDEEQFEIACDKFELTIPMLEEEYSIGIKILFSKEMEEIRETNLDKFNYLLTVCYMKLKYFPFDEIIQRFLDLGLNKMHLKWFISIGAINKEFQVINRSKIILILPFDSFMLINNHLNLKIMNEIYLWNGKAGKRGNGTVYNELHNMVHDLFRSKDYYRDKKLDFKGTESEMKMNNSFLKTKKLVGDYGLAKITAKLALQGKTEKTVLPYLMHCICFHPDAIPAQNESFAQLFNLFRIILPDRIFYSSEEFEKSDAWEKYNRNYKGYQYSTLKSLLKSTRKKSDK